METVWIVLIVAIALIIIVFLLRDRITFLGGSVSRNQNGVETLADARLGADPSHQLGTGTRISGNKMVGNRQSSSSSSSTQAPNSPDSAPSPD